MTDRRRPWIPAVAVIALMMPSGFIAPQAHNPAHPYILSSRKLIQDGSRVEPPRLTAVLLLQERPRLPPLTPPQPVHHAPNLEWAVGDATLCHERQYANAAVATFPQSKALSSAAHCATGKWTDLPLHPALSIRRANAPMGSARAGIMTAIGTAVAAGGRAFIGVQGPNSSSLMASITAIVRGSDARRAKQAVAIGSNAIANVAIGDACFVDCAATQKPPSCWVAPCYVARHAGTSYQHRTP